MYLYTETVTFEKLMEYLQQIPAR